MTRFKALLFPTTAALFLTGCLFDSGDSNDRRMTLSARWTSGDSVFVFSVHDEIPLAGMPRGRQARVRLFQGKVNAARTAYEYGEIYDFAGKGCMDLRARDSLVFLSFYPYPAQDGADQEGCPNTRHGTEIFAGILGDSVGSRLTLSQDTVGLHSALRELDGTAEAYLDAGFKWRDNLNANRDICIEGGKCLGDLVESWDKASK